MSSDYSLVDARHRLLSTKLDMFDFDAPPIDPVELSITLLAMMDDLNGLGLSANQLGLPYRAFVMRSEPPFVCFNPKIVWSSEETMVMEEGCLTFPLLYLKIRRPVAIRARYQDQHGETHTKHLEGISARCYQHELDHMDGICYTAHASKLDLNRAKRRVSLLRRKINKVRNDEHRNILRRTA